MLALGPVAGEDQAQAGTLLTGQQECVGEQIDALLVRDPPGVEDRQRAVGRRWPARGHGAGARG